MAAQATTTSPTPYTQMHDDAEDEDEARYSTSQILQEKGNEDDDDDEQVEASHLQAEPPASPDSYSVTVKLTNLVTGILAQAQTAMEELVPVIKDIDACATNVGEYVSQARQIALDHTASLEQLSESFQETAGSALAMLNAASHNPSSPEPIDEKEETSS